ncbi:MAG TPA: VanZ family protein [Bacteroidia bacterium]|nr:VanZ family protein [Bacteroidia bacterium]
MKKFIPFILWTAVIFGLCSMPGKAIPKINWLELLSFDKFVHASIFFVEQIFLMHALISLSEENFFKRNYKWVSVLFCVTYGGSLEIMQYYVFSERSGDVLDFIANSTGCIVGLFLFNPLAKKIKWLA